MIKRVLFILVFAITLQFCVRENRLGKVADPVFPETDSYAIEVVPNSVILTRGKFAKFDVIIRRVSGLPHTFNIILRDSQGKIPFWFSPSRVHVREAIKKSFTIKGLYEAIETGIYEVIARAVDCPESIIELKAKLEILKPERKDNRFPVALIYYSPATVHTGADVVFDGSGSYDPDGYIKNYKWRIDGKWVKLGTATLLWKFSQSGYHSIVLEVVDNKGATNSTALLLEVLPR